MKILISSIACAPFGGSEGFYGWRACRTLASRHEVWVLTQEDHRGQLEKARAQGMVPKEMQFIFVGKARPWAENRMLARFQSWMRYIRFSRESLAVAAEWHSKIGFDLIHHVTYTTWRVGCPLWRLNIPLVWGPISGTEKFPLAKFSGILSSSAKLFEVARIAAGWGSSLSSEVRLCARHASHIFAVHSEALQKITRLRKSRDGVSVLCNLFYNGEQIASNANRNYDRVSGAPLKIFASGNLEGRKGLAIALRGLALAKQAGVRFSYRISSQGPELAHLQKLTQQLGLEGEVVFGSPLDRTRYFEELRHSDVYLLPSLREGAGQTMMEAMLAGGVPIVAAAGGPNEIVTDQCGFRILIESPEQMSRDIAKTLSRLWNDPILLTTMSQAAHQRIARQYSEEQFLEAIEAVYRSAMTPDPIPERAIQKLAPGSNP